jgi:hypothetical protein
MEPIDMDDQSNHPPANVDVTRGESVALSRRSLLSGASKAAVPVIVTLYSGSGIAAQAISSNLISSSTNQGAVGGKFLCLDTGQVPSVDGKPRVYDIGNGRVPVTRITDISYSRQQNNSAGAVVKGDAMCAEGGTFYRKQAGFPQVNVPKGVLVSATALSSFAGKIDYTDI